MTQIATDLERTLTETPVDGLPEFIGLLATFQARAQLRLSTGQTLTAAGPEELLTMPEVAKRLKVSDYRAYELARQGVLKTVRLGKSVRVKPSDLAEYVAQQGV